MTTLEAKRATLRDCTPSEVVTLADVTPEGGSMYERTVSAGTRVLVSWHSGDHTFVYLAGSGPDDWGRLVSLPASARVAKVIRSRPASTEAKASSEIDPLLRRMSDLPLWRG